MKKVKKFFHTKSHEMYVTKSVKVSSIAQPANKYFNTEQLEALTQYIPSIKVSTDEDQTSFLEDDDGY
ncbi:hypothetical protein [Acinetobacter sp. ANC 4973]|uniref:hypothetical protein n=1 Tax=Acinetobacter sp. ANC 4973 TaxID=1977871 RepID=UPI000A35426A|nr:hypothetical protein [Acinetobacter sp. ANC 4973]OTG93151.1 hypothetical protein B9T30_16170 [Acinetobacter sp. ANC 4973]